MQSHRRSESEATPSANDRRETNNRWLLNMSTIHPAARGTAKIMLRGRHQRRGRILVSAYALSPVLGSEPGAGWNICSRLAAYHDVTVLTRSWTEDLWPQDAQRREEAERFMAREGPFPGLTIHFVSSPPLSRLLQPHPTVSLRSPLYFQGYAAWHRAAYREAVQLHRERPYDGVHQLTISTFREPGYLWKLGVPFFWGPLAGGENIPLSYFADFGRHDSVYYALKNFANNVHRWTKWRSRRAARGAERVFVSSATLFQTVARWGGTPDMMLEVGAPNWQGRRRRYDGGRALRLCWMGLHIGRKALPIALRCLAELKARGFVKQVHLTILGSGPDTWAGQALCQQLEVQEMVTWAGQVPFHRVREELERHDTLLITSLQEGTPNVVMEALAAGLPIVCHAVGGMSLAVDESCGFKLPLTDRQTSIREFADAASRLVTSPGLLNELSEGALCRAKALSWDNLVKEIATAYDRIPSVNAA
jgi:glycosyltransferase involved in cell wall biosynthesis